MFLETLSIDLCTYGTAKFLLLTDMYTATHIRKITIHTEELKKKMCVHQKPEDEKS